MHNHHLYSNIVVSVYELQKYHVMFFYFQFIKPGGFHAKRHYDFNFYCKTLKKLQQAIHYRKRRTLPGGIVLLHDNISLNTAATTEELLNQFGWESFNH